MTRKNRYFPFVSEALADNDKDTILFCFHHAGGTAAAYRPWTLKANDSVMIMCVELPGKGTRRSERMAADFNEILPELSLNIAEISRDRKIVLFGHSMGAAMAFYTAHYLWNHLDRKCEKIIVAGRQAPNKENPYEFKTYMNDDALIEELVRYEATPKEVLENKELLNFILPGLRQDYILNESSAYHGEVLDIPIVAHAGSKDYEADAKIMDLWQHMTTSTFQLKLFEGSHFFVTDLGNKYRDIVIQEAIKKRED